MEQQDIILTRCFCNDQLALNKIIYISNDQYKHIAIVLRIKVDQYISLFNQQDGEFLAQIKKITKNNLEVLIIKQIKQYVQEPYNIHLAYAPLKKSCNDFIIEKATELGINAITQIITSRTVNKPILEEKITKKCILSSQQCGRVDIPEIFPSSSLEIFINQNKEALILWLNENRNSTKLINYLDNKNNIKKNIVLLIGPEGGFTKHEQDYLSSQQNVVNSYLQTNILRAETAAIAALIAVKTKLNYL